VPLIWFLVYLVDGNGSADDSGAGEDGGLVEGSTLWESGGVRAWLRYLAGDKLVWGLGKEPVVLGIYVCHFIRISIFISEDNL
jgi:hypothetical protein